jgi:hypothetical protein
VLAYRIFLRKEQVGESLVDDGDGGRAFAVVTVEVASQNELCPGCADLARGYSISLLSKTGQTCSVGC